MNRLDRLTAILTHLQSKRYVRANDIAQRFEISLRTVYRDIRALEEAGIPVIGEAGLGYSLVEGYRLPPLMFTKEEAVSFLMAEKIMEKVVDGESSSPLQSAMYKIKSVLKSHEKDVLEEMTPNIAVVKNRNAQPYTGKHISLRVILSQLSEKKAIRISYTSFQDESTTQRILEPVGVYFSFEQWYLIAWCRLRKAYRTFRVDRINDIQTTEEQFDDRHPTLQAYLKKVEKEAELTKVIIGVPQKIHKYLKDQKFNYGFVMEQPKGDCMELTFMTSCLEDFSRWLLMMGDQVTILQPLVLKEKIREILEKMLAKLKIS